MRNRCILSLLACGVLLYYALPRLQLHGSGLEFYFSWVWLLFLLFAIAGNMVVILFPWHYSRPRQRGQRKKMPQERARTYQN